MNVMVAYGPWAGRTTQILELFLISHPSTDEVSSSPAEFQRTATWSADISTHQEGKSPLRSLKSSDKKK